LIDPLGLEVDWTSNGWRLMGSIWWNDIASGAARDRIIQAIKAELSIAAGIAELILTVKTGGAAGAFIGMHGVGNLAGGVGDYLDIFSSDECSDRDWNLTRQGYENLFAFTTGKPEWGTRAFYLTDAAIGIGGMLQSVPAYQMLPYEIERFYSTPAVAMGSRAVVIHDTLQIMLSLEAGIEND